MTDVTNHETRDNLDYYFGGFHKLMPHRVQNVLLVSSLYELFILEEDGLLNELITSEYLDMNLTHAPRVAQVSTGQEALAFIREQPVDLVITMLRLSGWNVDDFTRAVKEIRPDLPVVVLAAEPRELLDRPVLQTGSPLDRVFVWNGDAKIFLAIVKLIEDFLNAEHDARVGDVRIIILVENSVRFYSTYLPLIYTELVKLTQSLMAEGINVVDRMLRMRARPKILLAVTFEEAWDLYTKFSEQLLGVVCDVRFPRDGELDSDAGVEFARRVKRDSPHTPVLLQSSDASRARQAHDLRAHFLNKKSPTLLNDLRFFIKGNLGFGDFVFTLPDGKEVARAQDLRSLEEVLRHVPEESIGFHARHNHFSNWLMARTEFEMAACIRPRKVTDFDTLAELRQYLLDTLAEFRHHSHTGVIADFSPRQFDDATAFARIGGGSMGGKGRGLAFMNALIRRHALRQRFDNVRVAVPNSAAIGTDVFDAFLDENGLRTLVAQDVEDSVIVDAFFQAALPGSVRSDLAAFLRFVKYPLAVRSSSLLEDSQDRPFAGIYSTYMIPNNHRDLRVRLDQLCDAIKLVYASAFFNSAKRYLEATGYHAEEEKMGVVLQELVGSPYGGRFYPTFSGVARSYNYYPAERTAPEDGVACVGLGLGKTIVEGGGCLVFSPAHPTILPQFASPQDMLTNSQRRFFALDVSQPDLRPTADPDANLISLDLDTAEEDGTLAPIGSVYSAENDAVYDGIFRPGPRLVTFAHVLKSGLFPLADILRLLLDIGRRGMAGPIEIEFAVDMTPRPMEFAMLQIRPIVFEEEPDEVGLDDVHTDGAICFSRQAMGNGRIGGIHDVVYVKPDSFDSAWTSTIATEVGQINHQLRKAGRSSIVIGFGRWGTADRWLGIPVTWEQVSSARVIVETSHRDFRVTPSQGTHFFQNLASLRVGYLTVDPHTSDGFIDWSWLDRQEAVEETRFLRHVRSKEPFGVRIDGRTRRGAIFKPADAPQ